MNWYWFLGGIDSLGLGISSSGLSFENPEEGEVAGGCLTVVHVLSIHISRQV
jgi:hypothetical protein